MENYFDNLLSSLEDAEVRTQFTALVDKAPVIRQWVADPDVVREADEMRDWTLKNWDHEHKMTKQEHKLFQEKAALEAQLATGNDMTFEDINKLLDTSLATRGYVNREALDTTVRDNVARAETLIGAMGNQALRIPYLNQKHDKEFGELFDPTDFVTKATAAKAQDLDAFYEREYVAGKRDTAREARVQVQLKAERAAGRQEALQERAMGETGNMPTLDGPPEMSHFQAKVMGMRNKNESEVPADAELGRGVIARIAARQADLKAMQEGAA